TIEPANGFWITSEAEQRFGHGTVEPPRARKPVVLRPVDERRNLEDDVFPDAAGLSAPLLGRRRAGGAQRSRVDFELRQLIEHERGVDTRIALIVGRILTVAAHVVVKRLL